MTITSASIPEQARALIGVKRIRQHQVSEDEIIRFAQAIGDDVTGSRDGLEAPLLFCQALSYEAVPPEQLPADGSPRELDIPIPATRTVGGSSEYVIRRRVRAGETVTIESSLKDLYTKQGKSGILYCVVVETRFTDADGKPIAHEVATFIKRV